MSSSFSRIDSHLSAPVLTHLMPIFLSADNRNQNDASWSSATASTGMASTPYERYATHSNRWVFTYICNGLAACYYNLTVAAVSANDVIPPPVTPPSPPVAPVAPTAPTAPGTSGSPGTPSSGTPGTPSAGTPSGGAPSSAAILAPLSALVIALLALVMF